MDREQLVPALAASLPVIDGIAVTRHGAVAQYAQPARGYERHRRIAGARARPRCGELAADRAVRAVVLSAVAGTAGLLRRGGPEETAGMTDADLLRQRPVIRAAFGAVLGLPQPAVAAVHGFALGGRFELALYST